MQVCEQRLATIKVPEFISRTPHSLEECSSWEGILNDLIHDLYSTLIFLAVSECWSWILYYSIPVMHDILPAPYINHHAKLVTSMHICFSDRINRQQLQLMKQQLHEFYRDYQVSMVTNLDMSLYLICIVLI